MDLDWEAAIPSYGSWIPDGKSCPPSALQFANPVDLNLGAWATQLSWLHESLLHIAERAHLSYLQCPPSFHPASAALRPLLGLLAKWSNKTCQRGAPFGSGDDWIGLREVKTPKGSFPRNRVSAFTLCHWNSIIANQTEAFDRRPKPK